MTSTKSENSDRHRSHEGPILWSRVLAMSYEPVQYKENLCL